MDKLLRVCALAVGEADRPCCEAATKVECSEMEHLLFKCSIFKKIPLIFQDLSLLYSSTGALAPPAIAEAIDVKFSLVTCGRCLRWSE